LTTATVSTSFPYTVIVDHSTTITIYSTTTYLTTATVTTTTPTTTTQPTTVSLVQTNLKVLG
jgi:hypothetical protein